MFEKQFELCEFCAVVGVENTICKECRQGGKNMFEKNVKITWVSCGTLGERKDAYIAELVAKGYDVKPDASVEIKFNFGIDWKDKTIIYAIYGDMNTYSGKFYDAIAEVMPAERSHTALSIGDIIEIDGRAYTCEEFGWSVAQVAA